MRLWADLFYTLRQLAVLALLPLLLTVLAAAQDGGLLSDYDLNQSNSRSDSDGANGFCGTGNNCHEFTQSSAAISITANQSGPYTAGETNISINVTTSIPPFTNNGTILGMMLVNSSNPGENIKNDGWVITKDANNNVIAAKNYNEKTGLATLNQSYFWNLTAPGTAGIYYLVAQARYGKTGGSKVYYNITSAPLTMNVQPKTIDVTLSNVPVNFGDVSAGYSNQPALLPLNVTIQSTTNVNVNLTLNGSDFTYLAYSFGVGNLSYSNSSAGTKINMVTSFPPPPFASWVNLPKRVITNRSVYFWINIPAGQDAGAYSSNVSVRAEEYI